MNRNFSLWVPLGALLMAAAAAASFVHQIDEVRQEARGTFASRNALVQKYVTLTKAELEVMSLLLQQAYDAPAAPATQALLQPGLHAHDDVWELRLPLERDAAGHGAAVVTGPSALPLSAQQSREIVAVANMAPQVRTTFKYFPDVYRLFYVSADRFLYLASNGNQEHVHFSPDLYQRGYWLAGAPERNPEGRSFLYGPYEDAGGRGTVVTFVQPVYDQRQFIGVLGLDLGVDKLQQLATVGHAAGDSLLIGDDDRVIWGPASGSSAPDRVVRAPAVRGGADWQHDVHGISWLSNAVGKDGLWLVHRLERGELLRAAAYRSADTWLILLLSGGFMVLALRLRRALNEVERLTEIDPLTQLLNRRGFYHKVRTLLPVMQRRHCALAVVVFDIDHFKKINDVHGHAMGDEVLKALGAQLTQALRASDVLCRWGGEEFVALLVVNPSDDAATVATAIAQRLREQGGTTRIGPDGPAITLSGGLARLREGEEVDSAIARADACLYRAKEGGRNQLVAEA